MSHHIVQGLLSARPCKKPPFIPSGTTRNRVARLGISYEKKVGEAIPSAFRGQWFQFEDASGVHYCQTDYLLLKYGHLHVLECKLTDCEAAHSQLEQLYLPVVSHAFACKARGIVIARNVTKATAGRYLCQDLDLALTLSDFTIPVLHWIGKGSIVN